MARMDQQEFSSRVDKIVALIKQLKAAADNDEINAADSELESSSSEGWQRIQKALTEARSIGEEE